MMDWYPQYYARLMYYFSHELGVVNAATFRWRDWEVL